MPEKCAFGDFQNGKRKGEPLPQSPPGRKNHDLVFTFNNLLLKFYENHFIIVAKNYP